MPGKAERQAEISLKGEASDHKGNFRQKTWFSARSRRLCRPARLLAAEKSLKKSRSKLNFSGF
jgi:hypothetical protein